MFVFLGILSLPREFRFRKNYGPNEEIEANKAELKDKYAKAKQLGREVTVKCLARASGRASPLRIRKFGSAAHC